MTLVYIWRQSSGRFSQIFCVASSLTWSRPILVRYPPTVLTLLVLGPVPLYFCGLLLLPIVRYCRRYFQELFQIILRLELQDGNFTLSVVVFFKRRDPQSYFFVHLVILSCEEEAMVILFVVLFA